jgi:hypothetical protein
VHRKTGGVAGKVPEVEWKGADVYGVALEGLLMPQYYIIL